MITDTEGKLLAAAEYSPKSLLITRFAYASAIRLTLPTATGIHKMAEVLEEKYHASAGLRKRAVRDT